MEKNQSGEKRRLSGATQVILFRSADGGLANLAPRGYNRRIRLISVVSSPLAVWFLIRLARLAWCRMWVPWMYAVALVGLHGNLSQMPRVYWEITDRPKMDPLGGMTTVPVAVVHVGDLEDLCIGADSRSKDGPCLGREMEEGKKASELRDVMQTEGRGAKPANQEMSNDGVHGSPDPSGRNLFPTDEDGNCAY